MVGLAAAALPSHNYHPPTLPCLPSARSLAELSPNVASYWLDFSPRHPGSLLLLPRAPAAADSAPAEGAAPAVAAGDSSGGGDGCGGGSGGGAAQEVWALAAAAIRAADAAERRAFVSPLPLLLLAQVRVAWCCRCCC